MPNWCRNILVIEGSTEEVSKGLWLARHNFAESARPDVVRETPDSSGTVIPCHEFETVDVPPAECLQELSLMLPGAIVKCTFWEPFGGNRGFLAYRYGEL